MLNAKDLIPREACEIAVRATSQIFSCSGPSLGDRGKPCL